MSDPQTPEERYSEASATCDNLASVGAMIYALRDMIDSQDAELARLTDTVNRQENVITALLAEWKAGR